MKERLMPEYPESKTDASVAGAPDPVALARKRYYTPGRIARRLVLLLILYLAVCAEIAWVSVSPKRDGEPVTPKGAGLPFENVTFASADGTKLAGWFIPAPGKPNGVIVYCHGVDGNRVGMLGTAKMLHKAGYAGLLFDFRARGASQGAHSTLGFRETDDLIAAINTVKSRPDMAGVPIGLYGHSMGGAVVLMGAARCQGVKAVIAESPFARLDHAIHNHFSHVFGAGAPIFEVPVRWFGERMIGTHTGAISPVNEIGRISPRAVLLIQDEDDYLCPPAETQALFTACGAPKELWSVPHAGHIMAMETEPAEYEMRIDTFFDRYLHKRSAIPRSQYTEQPQHGSRLPSD